MLIKRVTRAYNAGYSVTEIARSFDISESKIKEIIESLDLVDPENIRQKYSQEDLSSGELIDIARIEKLSKSKKPTGRYRRRKVIRSKKKKTVLKHKNKTVKKKSSTKTKLIKKYSTAVIRQACLDYASGAYTITQLADKYKVSRSTIRRWCSGW